MNKYRKIQFCSEQKNSKVILVLTVASAHRAYYALYHIIPVHRDTKFCLTYPIPLKESSNITYVTVA